MTKIGMDQLQKEETLLQKTEKLHSELTKWMVDTRIEVRLETTEMDILRHALMVIDSVASHLNYYINARRKYLMKNDG